MFRLLQFCFIAELFAVTTASRSFGVQNNQLNGEITKAASCLPCAWDEASCECQLAPQEMVLQEDLPTPSEKPWMKTSDTPQARAAKLLEQMSLEEKLSMLHGYAGNYTGNVPANSRLGIPALKMNDGPQGFRDDVRPGTTTAWPSALTMAASWDVELLKEWGTAIAKEFYLKGSNVYLGPGLCVARLPVNGRNFEYMSGEDPYLGYALVKPMVEAVQSNGIIANAKHWIANNQEYGRQINNAIVDERTRFEIHYLPFIGAIEAGVGSVMCSYNKVNGAWSCENNSTLNGDLKNYLGFKDGWVVSDWKATHSTSMNKGLDQEMPANVYMNTEAIKKDLKSGDITQEMVDDSVRRILTPMFSAGLFDYTNNNTLENNVTSPEHSALARKFAGMSTVLLKNSPRAPSPAALRAGLDAHDEDAAILPLTWLDPKQAKIAVIGVQADDPIAHGAGSGHVHPAYVISPLSAILRQMGLEKPSSSDCEGVCVFYADGYDEMQTAEVAKKSDVALVFVGTSSTEAADRSNLTFSSLEAQKNLDLKQPRRYMDLERMIGIAGAKQPNTVVIGTNPGAVLTSWRETVKGILLNFMPGQEMGNAVVDILWGSVNPAARLPVTLPNIEDEVGFTHYEYNKYLSHHDEGLLVGYRWYDYYNVEPAFPFGHGLSYTKFEYTNLQVDASSRRITFNLQNTGKTAGSEVVQVYVELPRVSSDMKEPPKQLKKFSRVALSTGETATVSFQMQSLDFSTWNTMEHKWQEVTGTVGILVGASSRDIRLQGAITI
ncbi:hypothetical protein CYMTET_11035 [Cymbomonas tetramitiformis]|uniref:Probable beta-glucosidase G n=1 Tax=Cymbomonas tetramitiformis TaxID=36881 RepID=A0AAE0GNE3_9CHLO|nr:hypothetical protein CYMTET_11035 [Cymbomonas tetramitiformis]